MTAVTVTSVDGLESWECSAKPRTAFDQLAASKGDATPYYLTAAVSAGAANYEYLVVPQMDKVCFYVACLMITTDATSAGSDLLEPDGVRLRRIVAHLRELCYYRAS